MRYKMLPSLIAAGAAATEAAFPIVARGDIYWPEHSEASSNHQYIHLNDTLVAPIWDSSKNETSRSVWVPPGQWTDAWDGSVVTGPKTITVTQPYARQPMWHRAGGLLVLASDPDAMRVEEQDWSEITLEAHPHTTTSHPLVTRRTLRERGSGARTDIVMTTTAHPTGTVSRFDISPHPNADSRAWVIRLHLRPGQKATTASIDGVSVMSSQLTHLAPRSSGHGFLPFGGKDSRPAPLAGHVVQISVPSSASTRHVMVNIETE